MHLKAKIVSLSDERATLEFDDGQKITIPKETIEGIIKPGVEIGVVLVALGAEDAGRQVLARDLLNSLLLP
jgi:hypothetical protein